MTTTTIRELITALEEREKELGEDTLVAVYDEYAASEGFGYTEEDFYLDPGLIYDKNKKILFL